MLCPTCAPLELQPTVLDTNLSAQRCPGCQGLFISSADYWAWREQHGPDLPEQPDPQPIPPDVEASGAKQCPLCRHLLLPYKIALDILFTVDHCGACNGMWFEKEEWNSLQRRQLHDNLHQMFAAPWQRRLRMAEHRTRMDAIYRAKFGEEDYAEVQRVKAWLDAHPQRQALRAYLNAEALDSNECLWQ